MMADSFHNELAEKSILGLLLTKPNLQRQIIPELRPEDFESPDHQKIFRVFEGMFAEKKEIDFVTAGDQISETYDADTAGTLTQKMAENAQAMIPDVEYHFMAYVEIIKKASKRRRARAIFEGATTDLLTTPEDSDSIIEKVRQQLRDIESGGDSWTPIDQVIWDTYRLLERRKKGDEPIMPSGIPPFDRLVSGFFKGELTIIGARPAVGKSAMGMQIAMAAAERGFKVAYVSREMTGDQYGIRLLSRNTDVTTQRMRTGSLSDDDWQQIATATGPISKLPVRLGFTTRYVEDLRMEVQQLVDEGQLDLLVVDYVQLMETKRRCDQEYQRIGYVSKLLKALTVDFHIAVVALAQVGRSSDKTMPSLSDLRGSGELEQDADNVIFLHRPESADDPSVNPRDRRIFDELEPKGLQYISLKIAKQRQGQTGIVNVVFDPSHMRYVPLPREVDAVERQA